MEMMLAHHGQVHTITRDYKRYVGAQIGIHNPAGDKVGTVSHLKNKEFLYVVTPLDSAWDPASLAEHLQPALFDA
jgi:adenine-specific DNA-methyltransferase